MSEEAREDAQWLGSLSDVELAAHVGNGGNIALIGIPAGATVTVDARAYTGGVGRVVGLRPSCVHCVVVTGGAPGGCIGAFVRVARGGCVSVVYDDAEVGLRAVPGDLGGEGKRPGDRGVAVMSRGAAAFWDAIAGFVDDGVLDAAGLRVGVAVVGSELPEGSEVAAAFTALPKIRAEAGMGAAEITAYNMDRSAYVTRLIETRYGDRLDALLGELQLSFIMFALPGSVHGLEHWAHLLRELCACHEMCEKNPGFARAITAVLAHQLQMLNADAVELLGESRIVRAVARFLPSAADCADVSPLADVLEKRFHWTRRQCADDDGDDSDGPVIVSL